MGERGVNPPRGKTNFYIWKLGPRRLIVGSKPLMGASIRREGNWLKKNAETEICLAAWKEVLHAPQGKKKKENLKTRRKEGNVTCNSTGTVKTY